MAFATIKRNDTARLMRDTLKYGDATIDLTGATVRLIMKDIVTDAVITRNATILDAEGGQVEVLLLLADVSVVRVLRLEWEVTFGSGRVVTVPDDGYHVLSVIEDLG